MATRSIVTGAVLATVLAGGAALAAGDDLVARGEYLARIMLCADCHSPLGEDGTPDLTRQMSGASMGFEVPGLGVFFPPNLTPHAETGLGGWTDAEIIDAVRTGARPDGRMLAPMMPSRFYAGLSDDDAAALVAYLRTLPPTPNQVPGPFASGDRVPAPYLTARLPE